MSKNRTTRKFVVACGVTLLPLQIVSAQPRKFGELLVQTRSASDLNRALENSDYAIFSERSSLFASESSNWTKVVFDENSISLQSALEELKRNPEVTWAEPNLIYKSFQLENDLLPPNGPYEPPLKKPALPPAAEQEPGTSDSRLFLMWATKTLKLPEVWSLHKGNKKTIVADIDTGIDYTHEDLISSLWRNPKEIAGDKKDNDGNGFTDDVIGWDFVNNDALPYDNGGHGTHTAGIIAATEHNSIGVAGVSPGVSLMALRFIDGKTGSGELANALKCIRYAMDNGAMVLNNSWGGSEYSKALSDIIELAGKKGITFVAAAGNSQSNNDVTPIYPAAYKAPNLIAVASSRRTDEMSGFSNYGAKSVHLAAPGTGIYSTLPMWARYRYGMLDGTSMAAPQVTGAAALLKSAWPQLTPVQIKSLLMTTADKLPAFEGKVKSGGRLNIFAALQTAIANFGMPEKRIETEINE